jgi:uncharacterized protein YdaU (DUF1376 family)
MKRPWMPLYIGDFSADTEHLNATETGAYIRLIMHCWQHGTIPRDRRKLALIAHCDTRLWHQYEQTVLQFFDVVDASTMSHKRVSTELHRCEEISSKRKAAVQQRINKRSSSDHQVHTHSQSHSYKKESAGAREANGGRPLAPALSGEPLTLKAWEDVVTSYKKFGLWSRQAGPEPSSPACKCPKEILVKHGIPA